MERAFYGWGLLFCCLEKASRTKYGTSQKRERKQMIEPMAGVMQGLPMALALSLHPAVGLGPGWWMTATPAAVGLLALLGRRACGKSGLFLGSEKHLEIVCWNISLMFHVFIIQNCLGSLLGLVNSLRTCSSTMCRNCGSLSNAYTSAGPTRGCCPPPRHQHWETALSKGWMFTWVRRDFRRRRQRKEKVTSVNGKPVMCQPLCSTV